MTLAQVESGERPDPDAGERTSLCEECNRRITAGLDGTEYGHARNGQHGNRCSRRPDSVDPIRDRGATTESAVRNLDTAGEGVDDNA